MRYNPSLAGRGVEKFVACFKTTTISWPSKPGACSISWRCLGMNTARWSIPARWEKSSIVAPWRTKPVHLVTWDLKASQHVRPESEEWRASFSIVSLCDRDWEQQEWDWIPGLSQFRGLCEGSWLQITEINQTGLMKKKKKMCSKILCSSQNLQESQSVGYTSGDNAQRPL